MPVISPLVANLRLGDAPIASYEVSLRWPSLPIVGRIWGVRLQILSTGL